MNGRLKRATRTAHVRARFGSEDPVLNTREQMETLAIGPLVNSPTVWSGRACCSSVLSKAQLSWQVRPVHGPKFV